MKTSKISMVGPKKARRSLSIDTIQPQEWPWNPDLPQTPHSWEVSSALSLWSRRWQDGASARQQGPGPKPVTTDEAMFIATPCRRWDVHSMHSCSVINCTGVGWGGGGGECQCCCWRKTASRWGSEATEMKLLEQRAQSKASSLGNWNHKPHNSLSINKVVRTPLHPASNPSVTNCILPCACDMQQGLIRLRPHPAQLCQMLRVCSHVNLGVTPTMDASTHTLYRWRGGDSQSPDQHHTATLLGSLWCQGLLLVCF